MHVHQMILKAIENGNGHTTKTGIEKYIRSIYNVDPMVLLLEHMEQCKRLQRKIQRNYKIYFVAEPRQGGGEQPTASLLEVSLISVSFSCGLFPTFWGSFVNLLATRYSFCDVFLLMLVRV
jgi:hypothetical protein